MPHALGIGSAFGGHQKIPLNFKDHKQQTWMSETRFMKIAENAFKNYPLEIGWMGG